MKEHEMTTHAAGPSRSDPTSRDGNADSASPGNAKTDATQGDRGGVLEDQKLVERCLAGEVAAWEQLYDQYQDRLLILISGMLHQPDASLVDEIAARVWYSLVARDGDLLGRYQPQRGNRLITFIRALARDEVGRYYRAEIRRHERERKALHERPRHRLSHVGQTVSSLDEFLATLSPYERDFCRRHLLADQPIGGRPPRSAACIRQLSHRIYKKLLRFVGKES